MGALTEAELDLALGADPTWRCGARASRTWPPSAGRSSACGPRLHVKYDTGMGRLGERDPDAVLALVDRVAADDRLDLAGRVDPLRHRGRARLGLLRRAAGAVRPARRAGARRAPGRRGARRQQRRHPARPGLPLRHGSLRDCDLRPRPLPGRPLRAGPRARARAALLRRRRQALPAGASAGYGRRWRAPADTLVGVLPIGYGDGVRRGLTTTARHWSVDAISVRRHDLDGQRHGRPRARARSRAGLAGGADRRSGRRADPRARRWRGGWRRSTTRSPAGSRPRVPRVHVDPRAGERADRRALGRGAGGRGPPARRSATRRAPGSSAARSATRRWAARSRDLDLAVSGDAREAAPGNRSRGRRPVFRLSAEFSTWRALAADGAWHVDVDRVRGDRVEADLALRDFTINAIAVPLAGRRPAARPAPRARRPRVPAAARRSPSAASPTTRSGILRAARIAAGLGLEIDEETEALAGAEAGQRRRARGRAPVRRAAADAHGRRPDQGPGAARSAGGDAVPAAGARGPPRRRAEPLPPPRRSRAHHRGARGA